MLSSVQLLGEIFENQILPDKSRLSECPWLTQRESGSDHHTDQWLDPNHQGMLQLHMMPYYHHK